MAMVDVAFALLGQTPIPADHGYVLYGSLCRVLPELHCGNGFAIHPIRGQQIGNRQLRLTDRSRLMIRVSTDEIGELIPLSGKQINVNGTSLRIGVPQVIPLRPAPALRCRLVTTKNCLDQSRFEEEIRRQLDALNVSSAAIVTVGKRRTLRVKDKEVVGYELIIEGLTAEESLSIQETGLGGRRRMGCGVFMAFWRSDDVRHESFSDRT